MCSSDLYILFAVVLLGCSTDHKTPRKDELVVIDTSPLKRSNDNPISPDEYLGIYRDTIPAADCAGIIMTVRLNSDFTFTQQLFYIGKSNSDIVHHGTYLVKGNLLELNIKGEQPQRMMIEEGELHMLNEEGKLLPNDYILRKVYIN